MDMTCYLRLSELNRNLGENCYSFRRAGSAGQSPFVGEGRPYTGRQECLPSYSRTLGNTGGTRNRSVRVRPPSVIRDRAYTAPSLPTAIELT